MQRLSTSIFFSSLLFCVGVTQSFVGPVVPGQSLWGINKREAETLDIIESKVCLQESQLDVIESIAEEIESKVCLQESQLDVIESKIDNIDDSSQLDVIESKICVIETVVDQIESKVCLQESQLDVIESIAEEIESKVCLQESQLDVIESKIDNVDDSSQLDVIESKICVIETVVDQIESKVCLQESQLDVIESIAEEIESKVCQQESQLDVIESEVDLLLSCEPTPIFAPGTISASGFYCLANEIAGAITIAASNVVLDLNNYRITQGVTVNGALDRITMRNGVVEGSTDAIIVNGGTSNINLEQVTVKNAIRGINFENVTGGMINNCEMTLNTTGLELDNSHKITVKDCVASCNTNAGFCLLSSTTNCFENCKALSTGEGNSAVIDATVFGFVSKDGVGNIFERCIANSTQVLTATDSDSLIAGFALRGTEQCSKIISSEAANSTSNPEGFTVPFGILIEGTLDATQSITGVAISPTVVNWSPDGQYVAVNGSTNEVEIFKFESAGGTLTNVIGALGTAGTLQAIEWSPDGHYIAVGGDGLTGGTGDELQILKFDRIAGTLEIITGALGSGGLVDSVAWSPDGQFIAVGGLGLTGGTGDELQIFRFDRTAGSLISIIGALGTAGNVNSVNWSPDGQYIAVGGEGLTGGTGDELQIFRFDQALGLLTSVTGTFGTTGTVHSVDWSPDGKFLAIAGQFLAADEIQIFRFNRTTETLTSLDGVLSGTLFTVNWSPDGKFIAAGGFIVSGGTGNELQLFQFDAAAGTLSDSLSVVTITGRVDEVHWSPDGTHIAFVGSNISGGTGDNFQIISGISFPSKNVIKDNTVYCNSGNECPGGVGISGSSIANMIIGNTAYSNPIPQGQNAPIIGSNYQFVTNVFNPLFSQAPSDIQNISLDGCDPICPPEDIALLIKQTLYKVCTPIPSQLDVIEESIIEILAKVCAQDSQLDVIESKIDVIDTTVDQIESKVCLQESQLDVIESKIDSIVDNSSQLDVIESKIDVIDTTVDQIESKVCLQESQLDVIESKIDSIVDNSSQLDVIESIAEEIESKVCLQASQLDEIESKVDELLICEPGPIVAPGTISASGFYCLGNEIVGALTIAASDVVLDLNNYRVTQGITINGDLDQITMRNGVVEGSTNAILVNGGSTNINLENVTAKNAIRGINFENVTGGRITNCEMTMNTTGLELDNSHKINVLDCVAACNVNAGFCLLSSTTNCFENCKALSTGEGNSEIMGATVFGFVSKDGVGNIFERCIANSTQSLTVTDTDSLIAGFVLRGTEQCSKIIECESANSTTNPSGATIPYGILIEPTLPDSLTTQTASEVFSGNIGQLTWSPDGKFIATATDADDPIRLRIFSFDRNTKLLTQVAIPDIIPSGIATDISWSPDGSLLAEVRNTTSQINIYTFDPANNSLRLKNNVVPANEPESVVWSPDGKFLAVGTDGADGVSVYRFDKNTFSITLVASIATAERIVSIDWALTDNLIVAGGEGCVVRIFSFDVTTNTITALATNAGSPPCSFDDFVSWSPDHKFIMSTGVLYGYDSATDTLTLLQNITTGLIPFHSDWSSDGKYFVAGSVDVPLTVPSEIQVFEVDRGAQTAEVVASVSASAGSTTEVARISWSPDGEYIAFSQPISGDTPGIDILVIADAFTFPKKNVITNNTIYCNSGNECPGGIGISGSSISNYIVGNTGYNNPFNYAFVTNEFSQNKSNGSVPSALQNISIGGCEPICIPDNVGLLVRQVCAKTDLLSSQIDALGICGGTTLTSADISGGTISITASGNYCVSEDLTTDFSITATCVTLDLNGRCITGIISVSTSDDIIIKNGNVKPAAPATAPSAGITVAATVNRTVISDILVQCADTTTSGVAGRIAVELHGNDEQLLNCTLKAGSGADASGAPGEGGKGLLIGSDASKIFVSKCIIASGSGGASTSTTGAAGGHGISIESNAQNCEIVDTLVFCTGSGGLTSGSEQNGGAGGHGISIANTVIDASVRNCTIRNTGAGGAATGGGSTGAGGKAVDDNVTTTANLSLIFANFAHNIANTIKFDLQAGGVETGVLTPNPPTSTVVNPLANVYAS